MATPFNAWGGLPGSGSPGLSTSLQQRGYDNEENIIAKLPNLDPIQQVQYDIKLNDIGVDAFPQHKNLLTSDMRWKRRLIDVFQGREDNNVNLINMLIKVVKRGIGSHADKLSRLSNPLTGSPAWNEAWIKVYHQWLHKLNKLLGEING